MPPQIRMPRENNAVEIEDLALLKLGRAPDRRERRQLDLVGAVPSAHAQHHRPMLLRHGKEVIDGLEIAGLEHACASLPPSPRRSCSTPSTVFVTGRVTLTFSEISLSRQSTPVTLERKSSASSASSRRNSRHLDRMSVASSQQRVLARRAAVGNDLHPRARHCRFDGRLDFLTVFNLAPGLSLLAPGSPVRRHSTALCNRARFSRA